MTRLDAIRARLRAATPAVGVANPPMRSPLYSRAEMLDDLAWLIEQLDVANEVIRKADEILHNPKYSSPMALALWEPTLTKLSLAESELREKERMSKRHPTFVCRKADNNEIFKCICGRCEAEALKAAQARISEQDARIEKLERALKGVIAVADRKTKEFDAARGALEAEKGR